MAPTPNGEIHWGNLMNFALIWAAVRKTHGKLWLRFDDIDGDRCEEKYAQATREILRHLGLHWDDEYSGQRNHLNHYRHFLDKVPHYACTCSRQDVQKRTGDFHYDGHCRDKGLPFRRGQSAIRFRHPSSPQGDFVLWRKEDIPAYHLTSVADDGRMGVNLIIRGEDLLESTAIQQELSRAHPDDPLSKVHFIHHPLITGIDGEKLSKSRAHGDLWTLMKHGMSAEEMWLRLSTLMALPSPLRKAEDLLDLHQ